MQDQFDTSDAHITALLISGSERVRAKENAVEVGPMEFNACKTRAIPWHSRVKCFGYSIMCGFHFLELEFGALLLSILLDRF